MSTINTQLLPRPFSSDRPRVEGYEPIISGRVSRIGRRKRNSWRAEALVDGTAMTLSHHDTKEDAETHLAGMIKAFAQVHYIQA